MPRLAAGCGILLIAACATRPETVDPSQEVEDRTGMEMPLDRQPEDAAATPPGVRLEDGLSEDEAAQQPLAGALFAIEGLGTRGLEEPRFAVTQDQ